MKLYLPYSSFRLPLPGNRHDMQWVVIHWFVVNRAEPIAPYPTAILGYQTLNEATRGRAERTVDEFLREDEFHQLRDYLRERHHEDPRTSMLWTPVSSVKPDMATRVGTLRPFSLPAPERPDEVLLYRLADEAGYSLPITVWGAYIAANHLPL